MRTKDVADRLASIADNLDTLEDVAMDLRRCAEDLDEISDDPDHPTGIGVGDYICISNLDSFTPSGIWLLASCGEGVAAINAHSGQRWSTAIPVKRSHSLSNHEMNLITGGRSYTVLGKKGYVKVALEKAA